MDSFIPVELFNMGLGCIIFTCFKNPEMRFSLSCNLRKMSYSNHLHSLPHFLQNGCNFSCNNWLTISDLPEILAIENPASCTTFEDFLAEVERSVTEAGQLLLFTREHLRLEVKLFKREGNPQVVWGLRRHEDWAFKATLLRLARGNDPVHLVLSIELQGGYRIFGWVIKRSMNSFWASPLPLEQAKRFWERCLTPFSA